MKKYEQVVIHFMDGSKIVLNWPKPTGEDAVTTNANIRKALEAERIMAEVNGSLLVIPVRNIKYVQLTPVPETLPRETLRGAWVAE